MNKEETEKLQAALERSLEPGKWRVKRERDVWRLMATEDDRAMKLPIHELENSLNGITDSVEKEKAVDAFVSRVVRALPTSEGSINIRDGYKNLYPVMCSASFDVGDILGKKILKRDHTAESAIIYALDFGPSYVLVNEGMLTEADANADNVYHWAMENLKQLSNTPKIDRVGANRFYFFSQDIYAASRILNHRLLIDMRQKIKGDMVVAIPHQDVLIVADLRDTAGYNVLGQMAMKFYGEGRIPITPLPMAVEENGELTPMLVLPETVKQKKTYR